MNSKQIRDLVLKVVGLYYLSCAVIYGPQFIGVFAGWSKWEGEGMSRHAVLLSVLLPLLFWLLIGVCLVFLTDRIQAALWPATRGPSEPQDQTKPTGSFSFWIVLVGLFYFLGAVGTVLSEIGTWQRVGGIPGLLTRPSFLSQLITAALSLFCVWKPDVLSEWLKRRLK